MYGFMLLVVLILLLVASCVSIVGTYFLLNAENYHWWARLIANCQCFTHTPARSHMTAHDPRMHKCAAMTSRAHGGMQRLGGCWARV